MANADDARMQWSRIRTHLKSSLAVLANFCAAGIVWVVDRLHGDAIFAWVRPMIPEWVSSPTLDHALTWGPPVVLVAVGVFFAWMVLRAPEGSRPLEQTRDVSVDKALAYMVFGSWDREFYEVVSSKPSTGAAKYDAFLQAAADGEVPVWGRKDEGGVHEPIPAEYWRDHRIDWLGMMRDNPCTERGTPGPRYDALMTSKAAVERLALQSTGK